MIETNDKKSVDDILAMIRARQQDDSPLTEEQRQQYLDEELNNIARIKKLNAELLVDNEFNRARVELIHRLSVLLLGLTHINDEEYNNHVYLMQALCDYQKVAGMTVHALDHPDWEWIVNDDDDLFNQ